MWWLDSWHWEDIAVTTEEQVYEAALNWLRHDPEVQWCVWGVSFASLSCCSGCWFSRELSKCIIAQELQHFLTHSLTLSSPPLFSFSFSLSSFSPPLFPASLSLLSCGIYCIQKRASDAVEVMKSIRFPNMSREYLLHVVETEDIIKENPQCLQMVSKPHTLNLKSKWWVIKKTPPNYTSL